MNMEHKHTPEITGLITPQDYEALAQRDEAEPRLRELRTQLGDTAGLAVAILVGQEDDSMARYIVMNGDNQGDSIRDYESYGLPDPAEKAHELAARAKEATEQSAETGRDDALDELRTALVAQLKGVEATAQYIDGALAANKIAAQNIDYLNEMWSQLRHSGAPKEAIVPDMLATLGAFMGRLHGEQQQAVAQASRLGLALGELEPMRRHSAYEEADERRRYEAEALQAAVRTADTGVQEAVGYLRSSVAVGEEISARVGMLLNRLDEFGREAWGHETYIAQISQLLHELSSEPSLERSGPLLRAQGELDALVSLRAKLESGEL